MGAHRAACEASISRAISKRPQRGWQAVQGRGTVHGGVGGGARVHGVCGDVRGWAGGGARAQRIMNARVEGVGHGNVVLGRPLAQRGYARQPVATVHG